MNEQKEIMHVVVDIDDTQRFKDSSASTYAVKMPGLALNTDS